jgi:hypothetical protein
MAHLEVQDLRGCLCVLTFSVFRREQIAGKPTLHDPQHRSYLPTGAQTGKIQLNTPGGTATSATNFTVTL